MAENLSLETTGMEQPLDTAGTLSQCTEVAEAQAYTSAMEEAARQFDQIIYTMFIANFLMIFTGRLLTRDEPYKIKVFDQEIYELPHLNIEEKWIQHFDNILFALNFTLLAFLLALNLVGYGYFTAR